MHDNAESTMKVALSMLTMVPGGMGGSETYARELTRTLPAAGVEATAYVSRIGAGFSQGIPEVVVTQVGGGRSDRERIRTLFDIRRHRRSILDQMSTADVIHWPFTVPEPRPTKKTVFVQSLLDVQHLDLPTLFTRIERSYRRRQYEGAAMRADAVITISEFAKQRIIHHTGIPSDKIYVAHLGVDTSAYRPNTGDRDDFLFYPARAWPHKNHSGLLAAVEIIRKSKDVRLVLTGGGLESLPNLPDWVDVRGLVPADELRRLYQEAACLVFPSRYEGFGLPPLEAMASGCPVAASRAGSLPEICGSAAVLFDPDDPVDIATKVIEAIDRSAELTAAGLERVTHFTWAGCATAHREAYDAALNARR